MTYYHDESLLALSLASLRAMIQRALEEQDEDIVPKHSAAVIDRMTDYRTDDSKRSSR